MFSEQYLAVNIAAVQSGEQALVGGIGDGDGLDVQRIARRATQLRADAIGRQGFKSTHQVITMTARSGNGHALFTQLRDLMPDRGPGDAERLGEFGAAMFGTVTQ